ncbi:MAG: mitochondrial fission ELM1 family protein [Candidatus Omnitrophica bacterium]|nr:mitochondrial fission ELM1 family protein [Candidatus Omnitrophota bacterium]
MGELIVYWAVRIFGAFVRILPVGLAMQVGKGIGAVAYHVDVKHRKVVYANLRTAFAKSKTPQQLKAIAKQTFANYGQNLVELFRFPIMDEEKFNHFVKLEGREHIDEAIRQGKGAILLAMHFGSWELANRIGTILGHPYKVLVKAQSKNSRLGELLNSVRSNSSSANVVERGMATREILKSLKNNEVVALVVDQGGRDGVLVPFFGKEASMSVGAVRIALKTGAPICFANIMRVDGPYHRLVIQKPFELVNSGDTDKDIVENLGKIVKVMEGYISQSPAEYMWFYKIWKYSKEAVIKIVTDGKAGHLRQAEAIASLLKTAFAERGVTANLPIVKAEFKNKSLSRFCSVASVAANLFSHRGRQGLLRSCLTEDSYVQMMSIKPDFIISCGSSVAPVNFLLSQEYQSKSAVILKPGILSFRRFDLVVLPRHDMKRKRWPSNVVVTHGAPNLITPQYLAEQTSGLLKRFSHLKSGDNFKIGVLLGGDTPEFVLSEQRVRILVHQLMETAEEAQADILLTTSRRTSARVENLLMRELKKYARCKFLVLANRENVPEAVGGILGLADVVVVSGDSISMVSEAVSSGKKVAAFFVDDRSGTPFEQTKHGRFLERLTNDGYILSSEVKFMKDALYKLIKNKVQTKKLDDNAVVLDALRKII